MCTMRQTTSNGCKVDLGWRKSHALINSFHQTTSKFVGYLIPCLQNMFEIYCIASGLLVLGTKAVYVLWNYAKFYVVLGT